ncbi:MAG: amidohydrolase [Candidatus Phosphoribacter sp.]
MTGSVLDLALARLDALEETLVAFRRDLHRHPELSFAEHRTTAVVAQALRGAGIRVTLLPGTGLVADLGAEHAAYRIGLRADLDALAVSERTHLPYASVVPGVAHACGHDIHVAAALGAALALASVQEHLAAHGLGVRVIFQPAEEVIPGGALPICESAWLDDVDEIYALHCDPTLDVGSLGLRVGPLTAAADRVTVRLSGLGGHTSRPQRTQDLVFALGKVVTEVPAALGRRVDPRSSASMVWACIEAGHAANVIPETGSVSGTLRVLDAAAWDKAGALVEELVRSVVAPYGVVASIEHIRGVPPVINAPVGVELLRTAALRVGLNPVPTEQSMGGEDFAWYLTRIPGAMARLGTRMPGGPTFDLHQGDLVVDEASLGAGARVLTAAVLSRQLPGGRVVGNVPTQ